MVDESQYFLQMFHNKSLPEKVRIMPIEWNRCDITYVSGRMRSQFVVIIVYLAIYFDCLY